MFRIALPMRPFRASDFAEVFAPMLCVGTWIILIGAWTAWLRPDLPEVRAAFAFSLALGLMLVTGPDQYGPYRFPWVFYLSLAGMSPALLQLTMSFPWRTGRWGTRAVIVAYVLFGFLGGLLAYRRFDPAVFLPVLFVQEEAGQLFRDIALAIAGALLLSIFVAMTVIPTATSRLFREHQNREPEADETHSVPGTQLHVVNATNGDTTNGDGDYDPRQPALSENESRGKRRIVDLALGERVHPFAHPGAERLVRVGRARHADHAQVGGQPFHPKQLEEGGDELSLRQVAGRAKDDEGSRRHERTP